MSNFSLDAYSFLDLNGLSHLPTSYRVDKTYPNPFNPSVTVPFSLPNSGEVRFAVFNLLGQEVYNNSELFQAGHHNFVFDASTTGTDLVSGLYFVQLQWGGQINTQKAMLLK